jgi:hypothetical protein
VHQLKTVALTISREEVCRTMGSAAVMAITKWSNSGSAVSGLAPACCSAGGRLAAAEWWSEIGGMQKRGPQEGGWWKRPASPRSNDGRDLSQAALFLRSPDAGYLQSGIAGLDPMGDNAAPRELLTPCAPSCHKPSGRHRARFIIPAHWNALRTTSKPHSQPRRQTDQFIGSARNSALSPPKASALATVFRPCRRYGRADLGQLLGRASRRRNLAQSGGHFSRTLPCSRPGRALYSFELRHDPAGAVCIATPAFSFRLRKPRAMHGTRCRPCVAKQRDELVSSYVTHGFYLGTPRREFIVATPPRLRV